MWDYIKLQSYAQEKPTNRNQTNQTNKKQPKKRQLIKQGKTFANHTLDKGLISTIYNQVLI